MRIQQIEETPNGQSVLVRDAEVSDVAKFLDSTIPWVWILQHSVRPHGWHKATCPLTEGTVFSGLVRNVQYDLQMPTSEFLSRLPDFLHSGMTLIQANQNMPGSLRLANIRGYDADVNRVLCQNGATMRLELPYPGETGVIYSFMTGYLSKVVADLNAE